MKEMMPSKLREDWSKAIGEFVLGMGEIEDLMNQVLRWAFQGNFFSLLKKNNLSSKCDLAKEVYKKWCPSEIGQINTLFEELSILRVKRNVVAHNGISVEIYASEDSDKHIFEFSLSDMYKPDKAGINLLTLKADATTLNSIYENLLALIPENKESLKLII
jgi:hypothetical protein